MADPWTGHTGDPVPVALRHRRIGTRRIGAESFGQCACGYSWAPRRDPSPTLLCPLAVRERQVALEAHEASLHKYGAWVRGEIVRYLRSGLDRMWARVTDPSLPDSYRMSVQGRREAIAEVADAIANGADAAWCEAHPVSPAPKDAP